MKSQRYLLLLLLLPLLESCAVTPERSVLIPHYTTTAKIAKLEPGMSIKQVNRTLDVPIHDIYHMSEKGTLMEFTYLQPVRKVGQSVNVYENPTEGETKYVQPQKMFVAFKDGKMTSMISQNGVSQSADITFQHEIIKLMMEDESLKKIMMEGNYPPVMQETQAAPNQMPSAMQKNASSDETESSGMSFWDILLN